MEEIVLSNLHIRVDREQTLEAIYRKESQRVYNIALRLMGNHHDAEDIVSEVFLKVHYGLKKFKYKSSVGTWIYRITINTCRDVWKKRKKEVENTESYFKITHKEDSTERFVFLKKAIENLPYKLREIFILHEIGGFTHDEIAKIANVPKGTSKSYLHRAKKKLREELEEWL